MHKECGYTFDRHGIVSALTREEVSRLWQGMSLWNEEFENADTDGSSDAYADATEADKQHFKELAAESGNGQSEPAMN